MKFNRGQARGANDVVKRLIAESPQAGDCSLAKGHFRPSSRAFENFPTDKIYVTTCSLTNK